ncbi:MAG TPA: hypothetical protein VFT56_02125 [Sphingomonas sp.]|nr:hypothetical protein [Sphingomonas sp.]
MRKVLAPLALLMLAGCVPQVAPPPPPAPAPRPLPAPAPAPTPTPTGDWRDWPLTPGDWSYRPAAGGSVSSFGVAGSDAAFTIRCDAAQRRLTLTRAGSAPGAPPMTIVTTSTTRSLQSRPGAGATMTAALAASDPLLDAMGYSRGRFVVEQAGLPVLVIPAWPEIERVTEDCRK